MHGAGATLDPNDPDDVRAVEAFYLDVLGPRIRGFTLEEQRRAIAGLVRATGIVPRTVLDRARAALHGDDVAEKANAALLVDELKIFDPEIFQEFEGYQKDEIAYIAQHLRWGVEPAKVMEMAEEEFGAGKQAIEDAVASRAVPRVPPRHLPEELARWPAAKRAYGAAASLVEAAYADPDYKLDSYNEDHIRAVETYYLEVLLPNIRDLPREEQRGEIVGLVRETGIVPQAVLDRARVALHSDDAEEKANAVWLLHTVKRIVPRALDDFTDDEHLDVRHMARYLVLGYEPAEAVAILEAPGGVRLFDEFEFDCRSILSSPDFKELPISVRLIITAGYMLAPDEGGVADIIKASLPDAIISDDEFGNFIISLGDKRYYVNPKGIACLSGYHPHPLYVLCLLGLQARAGAGALRRRSG